jgi:inward rectifier potassium channel
MSWPAFAAVVGLTFLGINSVFALLYFLMGPSAVTGTAAPDEFRRFLNDFFFSGQTLTTVGYGTLAPRSIMASLTATSEGAIGLLSSRSLPGFSWRAYRVLRRASGSAGTPWFPRTRTPPR